MLNMRVVAGNSEAMTRIFYFGRPFQSEHIYIYFRRSLIILPMFHAELQIHFTGNTLIYI